jgi:cell division protein FtsL
MATKKKKKANTQKMKAWFISVALILLIVLPIAAKMYLKFKVDLLMEELHQLEKEKKILENETNLLQVEVKRLGNVDRISDIASKKFGMIVNTKEIGFIQLEEKDYLKMDDEYATKKKRRQNFKAAGVY